MYILINTDLNRVVVNTFPKDSCQGDKFSYISLKFLRIYPIWYIIKEKDNGG